MPDSTTQTENPLFARRNREYYDCSLSQKSRLQLKIKEYLFNSDLKVFSEKIGLKIKEIRFGPNDPDQRSISTKLTIAPFNISEEERVYKWMTVKDLINISDKKYIMMRKFLTSNYIDRPPCLDRIKVQMYNLNNSFSLYQNDYGFFVDPTQKIKYVCEKFTDRNPDFITTGEKKFKIKLCADGVQISKKNIIILNLAFSLLNDYKHCRSAFHTYILGNYYFIC